MKNYLLFCYDKYYPVGGMCDFDSDYDTLDEAICEGVKRDDDFVDVYSLTDRKFVWRRI